MEGALRGRGVGFLDALYRHGIRPLLFRLDPERAHRLTLRLLRLAHPLIGGFVDAPSLPVTCFGIRFPNPVGLAAGMDKDGEALAAWKALGFGFVEAGGVTRHPQPGNPAPRLFRIPEAGAIINRMGFNNQGARAMAKTLGEVPETRRTPLGINLGKSRRTPLAEAHEDYLHSFRELRDLADFFVINISSPNTPGLVSLQERDPLDRILGTLHRANRAPGIKPLLLKLSPDLAPEAMDAVIDLALEHGLAGLVATNTTTGRPHPGSPPAVYGEKGGLSGSPLRQRSTEVIAHITRRTGGALPIIGVGGIRDVRDAWEKIAAGACLCQLYTGLIYEGPGLPGRLVRGLGRQIERQGLRSLEEAVGCGLPFRATP